MPTCREVTRTIASDEIRDAGPWRRLVIRVHLFRCRHCRRYAEQIRAIAEAVRALLGDPEAESERLARLERRILGDPSSEDTPGGEDPGPDGGAGREVPALDRDP